MALEDCYTLLVAVKEVCKSGVKVITGRGLNTGGVTYKATEKRLAILRLRHRLVSHLRSDSGALTVWLLEPTSLSLLLCLPCPLQNGPYMGCNSAYTVQMLQDLVVCMFCSLASPDCLPRLPGSLPYASDPFFPTMALHKHATCSRSQLICCSCQT